MVTARQCRRCPGRGARGSRAGRRLLVALALALAAGGPPEAPAGESTSPSGRARASGAEHFAFVRPRVPEGVGGPAREAAKSWHVSMCVSDDGTAYVLDAENCQIYRVKDAVVRLFAGDGIRGYRDGPADRARFDFGVGSYQDADIKCDAAGRIYAAEGLPGRLRRMHRDAQGEWHVATLAGGGDRSPGKGESIPAREMRVGCASRFALAPDGTVYFASHGGVHRIQDGQGTLLASGEDIAAQLGKTSIHDWHVGGSHITPDGWFYWMPGGGPNLLRLSIHTGEAQKVAGIDKLAPGLDGPTLLETGFHTVFIVYSPDASVMFTGGGDEAILRRIAGGRAAHIQKDGTFLPGGRQNGWRLYSPLCLDAQGRLYTETGIYAWGGFVARVSWTAKEAEDDEEARP